MSGGATVVRGLSRAPDPARAVAEAARAIDPAATAFALAILPRAGGAEALSRVFRGVPTVAVVAPGQITDRGYEGEAVQVLGFSARHFRAAVLRVPDLSRLSIDRLARQAREAAEAFGHTPGRVRFALSFADGRAEQEDLLISTLAGALDDMEVYGGSVGPETVGGAVFHEDRFHEDAALVVLLETDLDVAGIGFTHVLPTDIRMVVTDADARARRVDTLNGAPAAAEYARLVGCAETELGPGIFAENPTLIRQNRSHYVRAIRAANPDGSLSFLSQIDDGLILTLGRGRGIEGALEAGLDLVRDGGRRPEIVLGFDCILRRLEIAEKGLDASVSRIFRAARVAGLNTWGEQYCGLHLNQTFVGLAVYPPGAPP